MYLLVYTFLFMELLSWRSAYSLHLLALIVNLHN